MSMRRVLGRRPLDRMVAVGAVGPDRARVWFRAPSAGRYRVEIWARRDRRRVEVRVAARDPADGTFSAEYPTDFADESPLSPATRYRYRVTRVRDPVLVGGGRFETAPAGPAETPSAFSVGVVSCHQPFDAEGRVAAHARRMLRLARQRFVEHDAKLVLMCGDQMYADAPSSFSLADEAYLARVLGDSPGPTRTLTDLDAGDVRRLYQERYRASFAPRELKRLYADFPSYPILDDHEILDDWGSLPEHARGHARLARGAREAYFDYQASRVRPRAAALPRSFHYGFRYGHTAVFVLDVRSERRPDGRVLSSRQLDAFEGFLKRNRDARVVLVVSSVPVVHIPDFLADAGHLVTGPSVDFGDQWSYAANRKCRNALLMRVRAHQRRNRESRVVFVGGDVHVGAVFRIDWADDVPPIYQFTSSAITNPLSPVSSWVSGLGPSLAMSLDVGPGARARLIKERTEEPNPFRGLNAGVVEIATDPLEPRRSTVRFKLFGFRPWRANAREELFDSGAL